jgi:hypothetical protein
MWPEDALGRVGSFNARGVLLADAQRITQFWAAACQRAAALPQRRTKAHQSLPNARDSRADIPPGNAVATRSGRALFLTAFADAI